VLSATTFTPKLRRLATCLREQKIDHVDLMKVECKMRARSHPRIDDADGRSSRKSSSRHTTSRARPNAHHFFERRGFASSPNKTTFNVDTNIYNIYPQYVRNSDGVDTIEIRRRVIGAGVMGVAVAQTSRNRPPCRTGRCTDAALDEPARNTNGLRAFLLFGNAAEKIDTKAVLSASPFTTDYDASQKADFIIENVTEKWPIKKEVYARIEGICRPEVISRRHVRHLHHAHRLGHQTPCPRRGITHHEPGAVKPWSS